MIWYSTILDSTVQGSSIPLVDRTREGERVTGREGGEQCRSSGVSNDMSRRPLGAREREERAAAFVPCSDPFFDVLLRLLLPLLPLCPGGANNGSRPIEANKLPLGTSPGSCGWGQVWRLDETASPCGVLRLLEEEEEDDDDASLPQSSVSHHHHHHHHHHQHL